MKEETILLLAGVGIVGYGLLKSDFFKGLGQVGTGVGEAVGGLGAGISDAGQGLGSGISTIGREAGDIVVDVGSVFEPFAAGFQGGADLISSYFQSQNRSLLRESDQKNIIDVGAFSQSQPILSDIQAAGDINASVENQTRRSLREDNKTDFTRYFTNLDENAISIAKSSAAAVSGAIADAKRNLGKIPAAVVNVAKAASSSGIPKIILGSSSLKIASGISSAFSSSSQNKTSTAQSIAKERAIQTSANKNKLGTTIKAVSSGVSSAVSSVGNTAKSLLSSFSKKLKSIF